MILNFLKFLCNYIIIPHIYILGVLLIYILYNKIKYIQNDNIKFHLLTKQLKNDIQVIYNDLDKLNLEINDLKIYLLDKNDKTKNYDNQLDEVLIIIDEYKNNIDKINSNINLLNNNFDEKIELIYSNIEEKNNNLYADNIVSDLKYYILEEIDKLKKNNEKNLIG